MLFLRAQLPTARTVESRMEHSELPLASTRSLIWVWVTSLIGSSPGREVRQEDPDDYSLAQSTAPLRITYHHPRKRMAMKISISMKRNARSASSPKWTAHG